MCVCAQIHRGTKTDDKPHPQADLMVRKTMSRLAFLKEAVWSDWNVHSGVEGVTQHPPCTHFEPKVLLIYTQKGRSIRSEGHFQDRWASLLSVLTKQFIFQRSI